ncbi:hypothetical protein [Pseudomonas reactans]|uniref:hypothetical protein n=1 Tax=Pseudomonas reactans TaxID=117680 RepID=UPI0015A4D7B8|nr:hypothetical protein [Pseudomonas reactans]NWA66280.1 hypothetical protein [Pseudomonas reactans]
MTSSLQASQAMPHSISTQFASRPTLENTAWRLLTEAILRKYPTIPLNQELTWVGIPSAKNTLTSTPLMEFLQGFLGSGLEPSFPDGYGGSPRLITNYLIVITNGRQDNPHTFPDMALIKQMILELSWTLVAELQNSLADYWSATTDTGNSRWQWLSDRLMENLRIGSIEHNELSDLEHETLNQLICHPNKEQRLRTFASEAVHAYCPELVFSYGTQVTRQLSPLLLLVRSVNNQTCVLLCNTSGGCESFPSLHAFTQTWGQRMAAEHEVTQVTVNRYEPDGNIFDSYAAALLNQQLENLQTLEIPATQGFEQLEMLYRQITDPGYYFHSPSRTTHPVLTTLHGLLPDWLQQASPHDRIAYRQLSLALASAKKRSHGHTFLSEIDDIRTFTNKALRRQMALDEANLDQVTAEHTTVGNLNPEDLQLTFIKAVGLPETVGIIQTTTLSLTDLAINNLVGQPGNLTALKHRDEEPLPHWLTLEYINRRGGLIERVNIGKTYPEMLEQHLLGNDPKVAQREARFAEQTSAQLPLLALELKLKKQNGLTEKGLQYVWALVRENAQERYVDGRAVVIRSLALVRAPGAAADLVTNMFIIETQDINVGPHLLYRPLYAEPLLEFATRSLLLQALATPGALQTSVLTWLSDTARPIYDNGGFTEPHYVRFGSGSDFAPIETPEPAALATAEMSSELPLLLSNGKLMQFLYGTSARALVDQANRESVSNSESRWAVLMEGANLMFSALLVPLLRGPAMLTGWLISLISSALHDIPALNSPDPIARELALVDLLLNVGMLLLQHPSATQQTPELLDENIQAKALQPPGPRRPPDQWPTPTPPEVLEGIVSLDGDALGSTGVPFELGFSSARERLTPSQARRLQALQVPQPDDLPLPVSIGPGKGLYEIQGNWYAQADGHWYRVEMRPDDSVVVVLPSDANVPGPLLKSDRDGHWSLDFRLRLRGGMPKSRIADLRASKLARKTQLSSDYQQLIADQTMLQTAADAAQHAWESSNTAQTRLAFGRALDAQTQRYVQLLDTLKERRDLQIPVPANHVAVFLGNVTKNARKSSLIARADREALCAQHQIFFDRANEAAQQILTHSGRYRQFVEQLVEINESQIQALERQDRSLLELRELGQPGAETYQSLTENRDDETTVLGVKYLQLQSLKFSIFKNLVDFPTEISEILDPLGPQVRTHAELNKLELTPSDRLNVLESLDERYGQAVDALQGQAIIHAEVLDTTYFSRVQKLLESLYQDVTRQLAVELKPDAQTPAPQVKQPLTRQGKPQKKVIKTRKQGTLIGELKSTHNNSTIEQVEIRSEQDETLLATYTLHDGVWDEVRVVTATRPPAPATRPLNTIKSAARTRLDGLTQTLEREKRYAQKSHFPVEIEESMQREAGRYRDLASELQRALEQKKKSDQPLLDELEKAAETLIKKGQELRIQISLALPPTHANLAYLFELKLVQVARLGERIALRGERKDFIQEYAVNDRQGKPLWYAHFHYPNANTPKQSYSIAHLKSIQQRKESYYSLLAKSSGNQGAVEIHRGLIGKPLAQRWFLPLAS